VNPIHASQTKQDFCFSFCKLFSKTPIGIYLRKGIFDQKINKLMENIYTGFLAFQNRGLSEKL